MIDENDVKTSTNSLPFRLITVRTQLTWQTLAKRETSRSNPDSYSTNITDMEQTKQKKDKNGVSPRLRKEHNASYQYYHIVTHRRAAARRGGASERCGRHSKKSLNMQAMRATVKILSDGIAKDVQTFAVKAVGNSGMTTFNKQRGGSTFRSYGMIKLGRRCLSNLDAGCGY